MKRRILLLIITVLLCIIIYRVTYRSKTQILALGDGSCLAISINGVKNLSYNNYLKDYLKASLNDNYCHKNLSLSKLYNILLNNENQILKDLDQSDYITIMIGYDELTLYKKVDNIIIRDFLTTYSNMLSFIKDKTKAKIIVIGYYSKPFKNVEEVNRKLNNISNNNQVIFIDPSILINYQDSFYDNKHYNLTNIGNKRLYNLIKEKI